MRPDEHRASAEETEIVQHRQSRLSLRVCQRVAVPAKQSNSRHHAAGLGDAHFEPGRLFLRRDIAGRPRDIGLTLLAAAIVVLATVEEVTIRFFAAGERAGSTHEDILLRQGIALDLGKYDLQRRLVGGVQVPHPVSYEYQ